MQDVIIRDKKIRSDQKPSANPVAAFAPEIHTTPTDARDSAPPLGEDGQKACIHDVFDPDRRLEARTPKASCHLREAMYAGGRARSKFGVGLDIRPVADEGRAGRAGQKSTE